MEFAFNNPDEQVQRSLASFINDARKNKGGGNIEIELRLGRKTSTFVSGVNAVEFNHVKSTLMKLSATSKTMKVSESLSQIISHVIKTGGGGYRTVSEEGKHFLEQKITSEKVDGQYFRLAKATERKLNDLPFHYSSPNDVVRDRNRISFTETDPQGVFFGTVIDLTIVTDPTDFINGKWVAPKDRKKTFEVEMEYLPHTNASFAQIVSAFKALFFIYSFCDNYYPLSPSNHRSTKEIIERHYPSSVKNASTAKMISDYNSIIQKIDSRAGRAGDGFVIYRNEPFNLKLDHFFGMNHAITPKFDGSRKQLFISAELGTIAHFINPPFESVSVNITGPEDGNYIVDGELVGNVFYIFDVMTYKSEDVTRKPLKARLALVADFVKNFKLRSTITMMAKPFYTNPNFYLNAESIRDDFGYGTTPTDGLIIQPLNQPYKNNSTYKWKPKEKLTIDFRLRLSPDESKYNIFVFDDATKQDALFAGTRMRPHDGTITIIDGKFQREDVEGRIIECSWDFETNRFIPVRFRDDRPIPNRKPVAEDNWMDIVSPIEEDTIYGRDMVLMRRYHNKMKSEMLESFKGAAVLDIGSGRGGDLAKWKKLDMKVHAIEPNSENIKELESRNSSIRANVTVHNAGAEETERLAAEIEPVDVVSAFFSLTFFPRSPEMFASLIDTIDRLLGPKGRLIGAVLDGDSVKALLGGVKGGEGKYEGETFGIVSTGGNKIKTTIKEQSSMVHDVEEFLFNFHSFVDKLSEVGIVLHQGFKNKFLDTPEIMSSLPKESQIFSKLNRLFIFERQDVFSKIQPLTMREESAEFRVPTLKGVRRHATLNSPTSSIFHAISQTFSKEYMKGTQEQKKEYVQKMRSKFAKALTMDAFRQLSLGNFSKKLAELWSIETKSDPYEVARTHFIRLFLQDDEVVNDEMEIIEHISRLLQINIFLVHSETRKAYLPPSSCTLTPKEKIDILYRKERQSIVILNVNDHFEAISSNGKTILPPSDFLVRKMFSDFPVRV